MVGKHSQLYTYQPFIGFYQSVKETDMASQLTAVSLHQKTKHDGGV